MITLCNVYATSLAIILSLLQSFPEFIDLIIIIDKLIIMILI